VGQMLPLGHVVHDASPKRLYSWLLQADVLLWLLQLYPAGHSSQDAAPALLISLEAQAVQSAEEVEPVLEL